MSQFAIIMSYHVVKLPYCVIIVASQCTLVTKLLSYDTYDIYYDIILPWHDVTVTFSSPYWAITKWYLLCSHSNLFCYHSTYCTLIWFSWVIPMPFYVPIVIKYAILVFFSALIVMMVHTNHISLLYVTVLYFGITMVYCAKLWFQLWNHWPW